MKTPGPGKARLLGDMTVTAARILGLVTCLYFFICSLSFMSDSFRMVGGRSLGGEGNNSTNNAKKNHNF